MTSEVGNVEQVCKIKVEKSVLYEIAEMGGNWKRSKTMKHTDYCIKMKES